MRQRTLQLLLNGAGVRLLVIPVVESTERPAHRACHEHQRLLGFKQLQCLGSLARQVEVPRLPLVVDRREVESAASLETCLSGKLGDAWRRVHLAAIGAPAIEGQISLLLDSCRELELLQIAQILENALDVHRHKQLSHRGQCCKTLRRLGLLLWRGKADWTTGCFLKCLGSTIWRSVELRVSLSWASGLPL